MQIEIQSDSSTANSLTEQDSERSTLTCGIFGYKNESKIENKTSLCFGTTTTLQVCRTGILLTRDPTLHCKMDCSPDTYTKPRRDREMSQKARKQTVVNVDREHRDGCVSWVKPLTIRHKNSYIT